MKKLHLTSVTTMGSVFWILFTTLFLNYTGTRAQCQAGFQYYPDSTGTAVSFYDSSVSGTGNATGWNWDFGDGDTSSQQNPVHSYNQSGTYLVCLLVSFSNGCTSTYCDSVFISPFLNCRADFTWQVNPGTLQVSFQDLSWGTGTVNSWDWDFGDGQTSSAQHPTHTYLNPGIYQVCLTIGTTNGCSGYLCQTVQVSASPGCDALFSYSFNSVNNVNFQNLSNPTTVICTWDFGDGTLVTSLGLVPVSHTYLNGNYTVCLSITDTSTLCTDTYCDSIVVQGGSGCTADFQSTQIIPSLQYRFDDMSTATDSIVSWSWDFGDGGTDSVQFPVHTYAATGFYYVCLTITTAGACTNSMCQWIQVVSQNGCQAAFNYQTSSGSTLFNNTSTGSGGLLTCTWDFGDGTSATSYGNTSVIHNYIPGSTYYVCLTISDSTCTDTWCDSVMTNINSPCTANFSYVDSSNLAVNFTDQSWGNITSWSWDFGDGITSGQQHPAHTYTVEGDYTVCLTISGPQCSDTLCQLVRVYNPCTPLFSALPDSSNPSVVGMIFQITGTLCGTPSAVWWDFGDGEYDSSGTLNPVHVYDTTGDYTACACVVIGADTFCFCDTVSALRLNTGIIEVGSLGTFAVYPNPFSGQSFIRYALLSSADIRITVYDLTGREVQLLYSGREGQGIHEIVWNASGLREGLYLVKISGGDSFLIQKVSLFR
ncbi:MAG: PKD domain-containing protein [Bacteroidia bacterium]|nr:PKD domain-containing protein [Bacteroidia bacterium]